jgi:hypothetical protein
MKRVFLFALLASSLPLPAWAAGGSCNAIPVPTGITSCFYVSTSGADTNAGTSEAAAFAHIPGQSGCASTCASTTPTAGEAFVLKGGDSWTLSAKIAFAFSGTSSNTIGLGAYDSTWGSGRAILTGGGTFPGATNPAEFLDLVTGTQNYIDVGFVEFTGLNWSAALTNQVSYIAFGNASGIVIHDNYCHGWTHSAAIAENNNAACFAGSGTASTASNLFYNNVCDGADTDEQSMMCIGGGGFGDVYQNYIANLEYALNGSIRLFHDNTLVNVGAVVYTGGVSHTGEMISNIDATDTSILYNNVASLNGNGGVTFWQTPNLTKTAYAFNNVLINSGTGVATPMLMCGEYFNASSLGGGTCNWFNNTEECGPDSGPTNQCNKIGTGQPGVLIAGVTETNFHTIYNSGGGLNYVSPECASACPVTTANIVNQTLATANAQGYTLGETYSFSPQFLGNATVGVGANQASVCTAITALNAAAGAACGKDTTYGVTYNATPHTVSYPARVAVARPVVGAWDVGAYQVTPVAAGGGAGVVMSPGLTLPRGLVIP